MKFFRVLLPSAIVLAACGDSLAGPDPGDGTVDADSIAPDCTGALGWCAQGEASAKIACKDPDGKPYEITTQFSGKQLYVACRVLKDTAGRLTGALALEIAPPQGHARYGKHSVEFVLQSYTGGGTYDLEGSDDRGLQRIAVHGDSSSVNTSGNTVETAFTADGCATSKCKAIVAPESERVPHDEASVQEFRLRVQIQCEAEGNLWSHPNCEENDRCTFVTAPAAQFDVQCSN